jgi:hypothetical protein
MAWGLVGRKEDVIIAQPLNPASLNPTLSRIPYCSQRYHGRLCQMFYESQIMLGTSFMTFKTKFLENGKKNESGLLFKKCILWNWRTSF